jgi:hypothetical protein
MTYGCSDQMRACKVTWRASNRASAQVIRRDCLSASKFRDALQHSQFTQSETARGAIRVVVNCNICDIRTVWLPPCLADGY